MKKLAFKVLAEIGVMFVIMCLAIFFPAGSCDFWQAWLYLLIFFIPTIFITIYLLIKSPRLVKRRMRCLSEERRPIQKIIQLLVSFLFFSFFIIAGFDHRLDWSHIPAIVVILADVAVLYSWYIEFLVLRENSYASSVIEISADQQVISTGPYAVVRHPMYSGAIIMILFTPIALASWWGLLPAVMISFAIVLRLLDEEKLLHQSLAGYNEYCLKVRFRLIPKVW